MADIVSINGVDYHEGIGYPNPYYRTDTGIYSVAEAQFRDYLQREGTLVTDYWTGQEYRCFFRRNKDTNQTNDNITIYYEIGCGIKPGSIIRHYGHTYLVLNEESVENRVYHRSDGVNADVLISTYNRDTGELISVPAFAYDLTGSMYKNGDMMTVISGNTEFATGDNELSRKLKVNCEFEALGNFYKITNVNFKTGICRIEASITLRPESSPEYHLALNVGDIYNVGDASLLTASPMIDENPVTNAVLRWTSSDSSVVRVTEDGNALFVGVGTCAISCYWQGAEITETAFVQVTDEPISREPICEIDGDDEIYIGGSEIYTAIFYGADGITEDTTITPVWTLDIPTEIKRYVTFTKSGNTITISGSNGALGHTINLNLSDSDEQYHASKTIRFRSWF